MRWLSNQNLVQICFLWISFNIGLTLVIAESLQVSETESCLRITQGDHVLLVYNKQSPPIPNGINAVYERSGFLHPVNTLKGKTITETFPKDHPHQHGIFSAWVKTSYGDREIDFWNLAGRTGRVLHEKVVSTFQHDHSVGFEVDMIHRAEEPMAIDILRERWKVTIFEPEANFYYFDIESVQEAITDTPLVVHQYHYGGMALRGISKWLSQSDKDKGRDDEIVREPCAFLNSLGQDRTTGNHTPSTWVTLTGSIDQESVSIAVLGYPQNFRAPQPARLHGTKPYFCFTPCVSDSFEINRAKPLRSKYRYLVTDAPPDPVWIESQWQKMIAEPVVTTKYAFSIANDSAPNETDTKSNPLASIAAFTADGIFSDSGWKVDEIGSLVWSKQSPVYFAFDRSKKEKLKGHDLLKTEIVSGKNEIFVHAAEWIPDGKAMPLKIDSFELSEDESKLLLFANTQKVWRRNTRGDYWIFDLKLRTLKKLGGDAPSASLMFAKFSPNGNQVAFVQANNLYVQNLDDQRISPLTTDGSPILINGTSDWVNEEELDLRDGYRWSPDGQSIAFWQFDTLGVREFKMIDNLHDIYPRIISFPYPKVGETNSLTRVGVVSLVDRKVTWFDVPGDARNHYLPRMEWKPDSSHLLIQQLNRLQNENRVYLADPQTGVTEKIWSESDPAWVENENPVRWIRKGDAFLWLSECDGWRHLYSASVDGKDLTLLTHGEEDVIQVEAIDDMNGWVYYSASPLNATQRYLYRVSLDGGSDERVSPSDQAGWHTYEFSPDAQFAVHTYSTFKQPPVVELVRLKNHETIRVIADNQKLRDRLAKLEQPTAEFLRLEVSDGISLDAWMIKPPNFDATQQYPLLFHVYGEPHGQTVKDAWANQRGLWHWMLAQQGYVVASVDNRGTMSPRGRAWRKVVHRQIGILASEEQSAAAKALLKACPFLDPSRVGIWGWSGGGSMSLNMIFRYPEVYRTAIAIAPVAKQELYDSIYQERYMGLPSDNADGFRDGSPLTYAHQLQGNLLLVHGTADDNVHYQATEMLIDELISLKKYFSVMPYPGRSHSISEGNQTLAHLYQTLTQYLDQNLKSPHDEAIRIQNKKAQKRAK